VPTVVSRDWSRVGIIRFFVDFVLHVDQKLDVLIHTFGVWTYLIIFLVIFCETGLVVTPFLPGDSLLFAAGAFAARGSMNILALFVLLSAAAIVGDSVNYWIGHRLGPAVLQKEDSRVFKKAYLDQTHAFFNKYGGKAIVLGRFVPIVRTFIPFLAGVGEMRYRQFFTLNVIGGLVWVSLFTFMGYFFGSLPWVEERFSLVILAILLISVAPAVVEVVRHKLSTRTAAQEG
jgi:membrane-associated protein